MNFRTLHPRRPAASIVLLAAASAAMLPHTLQAEDPVTFEALCPNAHNMFNEGAANRMLSSGKHWWWKNDFPILIYNAESVIRKMDIDAAAAAAEDKRIQYSKAGEAIDLLQSAVTKLESDLNELSTKPSSMTVAEKARLKQDMKDHEASLNQDLQNRQTDRQKKYTQWQGSLADADALRKVAAAPPSSRLYWLESGSRDAVALTNPAFPTPVFTTEKVLVLVCKSTFGDGISVTSNAVELNGPDMTAYVGESKSAAQAAMIDRVYLLDASKTKNNSLEKVEITRTVSSQSDTLATAVLARHKVIHYSAGGGLLVINAPSTAHTLTTVPTTITTVITQSSSTMVGGITTASYTQTSSAVTAGTASYLLAQRQSTQGVNSVAGFTWYPFGHDTFPVTKKGLTLTYSWFKPQQQIGLFLGTSTNAFGNFTAAPAYEFFPGMQVFAGVTLRSKNTLSPGVTACSGYGTSPSFSTVPASTSSSSNSSTSGGVVTTTSSSATTSVTQTSGCSNGDKASLFSAGATGNTATSTAPAFSYGVLFNTNLLSRFTGFGK